MQTLSLQIIEGSLISLGVVGLSVFAVLYSLSKPEYRYRSSYISIRLLPFPLAIFTLGSILLIGKITTAISFTIIYILLTFVPLQFSFCLGMDVLSTMGVTSIIISIELIFMIIIRYFLSFLPI